MSESLRIVDARGLACPEPVIRTRQALAEGGFDRLEVLVDDPSAQENVVRFAGYARCLVEAVTEADGVCRIRIQPGAPEAAPADRRAAGAPRRAPAPEAQPGPVPRPQDTTVFITSGGIGAGDETLAGMLMRGFLYALAEGEEAPLRIILMNGGVKLAVAGSDSLGNLHRLADRGVEVLACGACLDFFQLQGALEVGRVSNMYEIAGLLLQGRVLRI